jgi:hypothetical protein
MTIAKPLPMRQLLQRVKGVLAAGRHHLIATLQHILRQREAEAHLRLSGQQFDLLLVNAGVKNDDRETLADVSTEEVSCCG